MTILFLSVKGEAGFCISLMKGDQDTLSEGLRVVLPTGWLSREWRLSPGTPASGTSPVPERCVGSVLGTGRVQ